MTHAYHAVIGTEEIRLPIDEVERFRDAAESAARDGARWVPIRISPTRLIEVLIGPYSTVRLESIELEDEEAGDAGDDWP